LGRIGSIDPVLVLQFIQQAPDVNLHHARLSSDLGPTDPTRRPERYERTSSITGMRRAVCCA
jgi:hypothetical protein